MLASIYTNQAQFIWLPQEVIVEPPATPSVIICAQAKQINRSTPETGDQCFRHFTWR